MYIISLIRHKNHILCNGISKQADQVKTFESTNFHSSPPSLQKRKSTSCIQWQEEEDTQKLMLGDLLNNM